MKPTRIPGMKVSTLLIVLEVEKSGPGMAARRTQASWRAKAVLMMSTSKALWGAESVSGLQVCSVSFSCCWRNSPQGHKGEGEAQQKPFVRLRHREGLLAQGRRGRHVCGPGAFDSAEAGDVADVFDQDGDDADAAYGPAAEHWLLLRQLVEAQYWL